MTRSSLTVVAHVLPRLSFYQGPAIRDTTSSSHIRDFPLADPRYLERDSIELLLGAEVCSSIMQDGVRKDRVDQPIVQKTALGWILSEGCKSVSTNEPHSSFQCTIDRDLNALVQQFWDQEREQPSTTTLFPEETKCEELFASTHERTESGRYVVRLPFAGPPPTLAGTRKPAERLLTVMEQRCETLDSVTFIVPS